jgi:hypothetical protein
MTALVNGDVTTSSIDSITAGPPSRSGTCRACSIPTSVKGQSSSDRSFRRASSDRTVLATDCPCRIQYTVLFLLLLLLLLLLLSAPCRSTTLMATAAALALALAL